MRGYVGFRARREHLAQWSDRNRTQRLIWFALTDNGVTAPVQTLYCQRYLSRKLFLKILSMRGVFNICAT
jgi:hypothetical protein